MATAASAIDEAANPKSVDASLWWDSFSLLLTELERVSLSSDLSPILVKKLKENHSWLLDTVSLFKPPNHKSREALNSQEVRIGPHLLKINPELKDAALKISDSSFLDEVQSYILVKRFVDHNNFPVGFISQDCLHVVLLQYYIERQCLLKCTRQIIMHALYVGIDLSGGNAIRDEALKLVSDGLECKLLSVLKDLLSSSHPEVMDVDLFTLWAEETLIEDSLVLDILFLAYYESLCICTGEQWKKLCTLYKEMISGSYNFGRLAISAEAMCSIYHAKVQLLLILVETLNLENILQMVHDETPFRQGSNVFSSTDVLEMDAIISSLNAFEAKEAGPIILTWAVFLCLVLSLPGKEEISELMEIDHIGYIRQAFEAASLSYFLEILQNDILKDSDGPVAGYRSVLRTFISAFIASYEINLQLEDITHKQILEILCKIYRGEESLCNQFWDRDSVIDGPIRCLLCNLEGEFPFNTVEFIRFLSALSEGSWPAECVYNFLDKSVGISTLFEISSDSVVDNNSLIVETKVPLHVAGVQSLLIPSKTRGHVLKVIDGNTTLVRWEYAQSGVVVLVLRLAQELYVHSTLEVIDTLDLLCRLITSNTAVCFALMDLENLIHLEAIQVNGNIEENVRCKVNLVEIICSLVKNLSPTKRSAVVMSMSTYILAKMLKCSPSHVTAVALRTKFFDVALETNILDVGFSGSSNESWLLSGRLAKMLLVDSEQNDISFPLTISVLEFTMQLVDSGVENDAVLALIVFSLQYVLVNHESWKYKVKHVRWKVTLKVLEVMKKCIMSISYPGKLGEATNHILLCDSSIHSTLFRVICTTPQALEKLYISRLYDPMEIEGLELAICSVLEILFMMLSELSMDVSSSLPVFHQAVLSSTTKPFPVVTAVISLISYFRNMAIQVGATRLLSMLFTIADYSQSHLLANAGLGLDDKQSTDIRNSVNKILHEQSSWNEDLFIAILKMLASAARYQPAFLFAVLAAKENTDVQHNNSGAKKESLLDSILEYIARSDDLIKSNPPILLNVLNFLKALWQGADQFTDILEQLKSSGMFWKQLSYSASLITSMESPPHKGYTNREALRRAYRYQCQSAILEIMAHDIFLQKKVLHAELRVEQAAESLKDRIKIAITAEKSRALTEGDLKNILSSWSESPVLGSLIKSFASCEYNNEIYFRAKLKKSGLFAESMDNCIRDFEVLDLSLSLKLTLMRTDHKVAAILFTVHLMGKLATDDLGSLSVSLVEKIRVVAYKMSSLPAFAELLGQYSQRGHSEGKELNTLILSDLYYNLQGEFEGHKIDPGPFKELFHFLLESKLLQTFQHKYEGDLFEPAKNVFLFDTIHLKSILGLDLWDHSEWRASKAIAERMLLCMQEANLMLLLATSKLSALKELITLLVMCEEDARFLSQSTAKKTTIVEGISDEVMFSCIDHICQCFHSTLESLVPVLYASEDILDFLAAQAQLLLHLCRSLRKSLSLSVCLTILKTLGSGLRVLSDFRPSVAVKTTMKFLLLLLLSSAGFNCLTSCLGEGKNMDYVEGFTEVSNVCLGLLPILCNCIETLELCTLSVTSMDLILRAFLTPRAWFPIIQKHLHLQHVIFKLQDKNSAAFVPVILKFLLTLARVRGGAEMLLMAGFFPSLRALFADLADGKLFSVQNERCLSNSSEKIEKPQDIWGLGLAVVTAIVCSLGDSSSCRDIVDSVIPYFFSEKAYVISYYLNAPDFPSDDHDKKKARAQRTITSLVALKETEHTLMLMCVLVKHWNSWVKAMQNMDSQLREKSIHLLAFISRGTQRLGESSGRTPPLLCPPVFKDEIDCYNKPSFVKSKNGWFVLCPQGCAPKPKPFTVSSKTTTLSLKDYTNENIDANSPTHFSDKTALQLYKNAFLLLKFLCLQAEGATKRAEEVGFIDLAHFPELPMPEILHGLQDQAIAIVSELCEANKTKQIEPEVRDVCVLLLHIMEMSLYLELCVSQICGIRPVLGRVEDFSTEAKMLIKAMEGHVSLKPWLKSLKQVILLVYPNLVQSEGFF